MKIKNFFSPLFVLCMIVIFLPLSPLKATSQSLLKRVSGYVLIQVEQHKEAWYVNPVDNQRYFLGSPADVFKIMSQLGLGISNKDLAQIPTSGEKAVCDCGLANRLKGRIVLQVEEHGEAWYIYPETGVRYYLGRPADAFQLLYNLGMAISDDELSLIEVGKIK